jgi:Rad3-related DNA helicase
MPPQRQMALHLVKALKNRRHVVLESPTGTGKSAAILCSVLAWQRHYRKMNQTSGAVTTPRKWYRPYAKLPIDHAWQYWEVENDCAFIKWFAIDLLRIHKNKSNNSQNSMSIKNVVVELEIPKLCERSYGNRKRQATMTMIHPQIWKWTRLKHRNNNSKTAEMNMTNKNATATGLIQIPETRPRVLIIVN